MFEVKRFKVDGEVLAFSLECPVCFNLLTSLESYQSLSVQQVRSAEPSQHVSHLCRRRLSEDSNSSIAALLIYQIPHNCKFNVFGCKEKHLLNEIVIHEKKCPERQRTVM